MFDNSTIIRKRNSLANSFLLNVISPIIDTEIYSINIHLMVKLLKHIMRGGYIGYGKLVRQITFRIISWFLLSYQHKHTKGNTISINVS